MRDLHKKCRRRADGIARQLLRFQTRCEGETEFVAKMEKDGNTGRVESRLNHRQEIGSLVSRGITGHAQVRSAHDFANAHGGSLTCELNALFKRGRSVVDTRKQM